MMQQLMRTLQMAIMLAMMGGGIKKRYDMGNQTACPGSFMHSFSLFSSCCF